MVKFLLWILVALLPLVGLAQAPLAPRLESILGTPLFAPTDIAVDRQGSMWVLEADPYFSIRKGTLTKLDSQGRFLGRLDVKKTNTTQMYLCEGAALAIDRQDNLYIADAAAGEIRKYSTGGQLLQTFVAPQWTTCSLYNPHNVTVDGAGNVYGLSKTKLVRFNAQGVVQWEYAPPLSTSAGQGDIKLADVQTDAAGNVYVLNDYFVITKLSAAGQVLQTISISKAGDYYFSVGWSLPAMTMDAAGNFYVSLSGGTPVYKFDANGTYQLFFPTKEMFGGSLTTAIDLEGRLYACAMSNRGESPIIYKFDPTGPELARWGGREPSMFLAQNEQGEFFTYHADRQQIIKRAADGRELLRFGGPSYWDNGKFQPNVGGSAPWFAGLALDGGSNVYTLENSGNGNPARLQKFDSQGRFLGVIHNSLFTQPLSQFGGLAVDPANHIYVSDIASNRVYKLDQQGQLLQTLGLSGEAKFHQPQSLAVDALGMLYVADSAGTRVQQFTPSGQRLRRTRLPALNNYFNPINPIGLSVDQQGIVYVSHAGWDSVRVIDRTGHLRQGPPNDFGSVSALSVKLDGSRLLTLRLYADLVCAYTLGPKAHPYSQIVGKVYQDLNGDCTAQADEPGLAGMVVMAEPGNYYGLSDEAGNYTIRVDTGTYTVHQRLTQQPGRFIQSRCVSSLPLRVRGNDQRVEGPSLGNQVTQAPYLSVAVASNRRRRCARNLTTVAYSNTGFAAAANTQVVVALPEHVVFLSADVAHTRDAKGNYVFTLGTLLPNQRGTITIQDSVACGNSSIRGLTVCTRAWITPANTYPTPSNWNQATIAVQGAYVSGDQTRFTVTNTGRGATSDSLQLRIYQDAQLARVQRFTLGAADSLVLRVPATGSGRVLRVEADQPAGHPLKAVASANVELPNRVVGGVPSAAMLALPPNDPEPEIAEDCQPIVDSFDPNDKQVVPAGVTDQRYTPTHTPLQYTIRFQNTGTDDAYRVVVVDTLSEHLDLSTLQAGAASHPYRLQVTGQGRPVLTFTFAGLSLPPSTRNEPASHGFVEFNIWPKRTLEAKTQVANFADIFFDYNEPVRTNTTVNRLYDLPLVVDATLQLPAVVISPIIGRVFPAQGRAGTLVTIAGEHFATTPAQNRVRFDTVSAVVLSASANELQVRVPVGGRSGKLEVVTADGGTHSSQWFTVYLPPTLTAFSSMEGRPGAVVTLTGTGFSPIAGEDTVSFNGVAAHVLQASATELRVEVPAGATTGLVELRTLGGSVRSAAAFIVWYPPALTLFSPGKGKVGETIILQGSNFATAARTHAFFRDTPGKVLQATATSLHVEVPAGAQTGPLRVETPGGSTVSDTDFVFIPAPTIHSFAPRQATVGELVRITGAYFLGDGQADTISFAGTQAQVISATPTTALVRVPKGAQSGPITVASRGGRHVSGQLFTVTTLSPADAITVSPNPTDGRVTVDWLRADFTVEQVQVFNAVGARISTHTISVPADTQFALDLTTQQKGFYLLLIQTSRGSVTKRVTIY